MVYRRSNQMSLPFTHALVEDGEIVRKYRWSRREAKWYRDTHKDVTIITLEQEPKVQEDLFELVGECLI
jgi:hypothetical protein